LNDGSPENELLDEPSVSKSWQLPTDSATAGCAAVKQMVAGERSWTSRVDRFYCVFDRKQGRIYTRISDNQLGSKADKIEVVAWPTDGWNY